jgi:hypothetical protein
VRTPVRMGGRDSRAQRQLLDLGERAVEVLLHVVGERLERRDVDDLGGGASEPAMAWRRSWSIATKKCSQGFAGAGGRGDEGGLAAQDAGQPSIWGSVAEPNLARNHSATTGCAQARSSAQARWRVDR